MIVARLSAARSPGFRGVGGPVRLLGCGEGVAYDLNGLYDDLGVEFQKSGRRREILAAFEVTNRDPLEAYALLRQTVPNGFLGERTGGVAAKPRERCIDGLHGP
jgi:hypothetical protein